MVRSTKNKKRTTPKPPKVQAKSRLGPVDIEDIELIRTQGSHKKGGDPGGESWVVMAQGKRAGTIYINMEKDEKRGLYASFNIFLNRQSQGRRIGRRAYLLGCLASRYNIIYAHMRKSNIASYKAALHAGFKDVTTDHDSQLVLAWHRP